jgi:hypothetical protein
MRGISRLPINSGIDMPVCAKSRFALLFGSGWISLAHEAKPLVVGIFPFGLY